MKFEDLLSLVDEESYLQLYVSNDSNESERLELSADNQFLKLFNDCYVDKIFAIRLYIKLSGVDDE